MHLYPRHRRIIDLLSREAPSKFDAITIANRLKVSKPVVRNELPHLVQAGLIQRSPEGRTYLYYVGDPQITALTTIKAEPVTPRDLAQMLLAIAQPDYEPKLAKLAWTLPRALAWLPGGQDSKEAVEGLATQTEGFLRAIRRLLATEQLWQAEQNPEIYRAWLAANVTEEDLEKFSEVTSQLQGRYAKLGSASTAQEPTTPNQEDSPNVDRDQH